MSHHRTFYEQFRTLGINYPALADGICPTLHPYIEEYEAGILSEASEPEPVVICIDGAGW